MISGHRSDTPVSIWVSRRFRIGVVRPMNASTNETSDRPWKKSSVARIATSNVQIASGQPKVLAAGASLTLAPRLWMVWTVASA